MEHLDVYLIDEQSLSFPARQNQKPRQNRQLLKKKRFTAFFRKVHPSPFPALRLFSPLPEKVGGRINLDYFFRFPQRSPFRSTTWLQELPDGLIVCANQAPDLESERINGHAGMERHRLSALGE